MLFCSLVLLYYIRYIVFFVVKNCISMYLFEIIFDLCNIPHSWSFLYLHLIEKVAYFDNCGNTYFMFIEKEQNKFNTFKTFVIFTIIHVLLLLLNCI